MSSNKMVPFYDVKTKQWSQLSASEVATGPMQAIVFGLGDDPVWIDLGECQPGPSRHPELSEDLKKQLQTIHDVFKEHLLLSFKEWEDGFRSDPHPDREIARWLHAADIYSSYAETESSKRRRDDIYFCILTCMLYDPETIWRVYKPDALTISEAKSIVSQLFGERELAK